MLRIAHLISGGGSTSAKVWQAQQKGGKLYNRVKTVLAISSDPNAKGLALLAENDFPEDDIFVVDPNFDLENQLIKLFEAYNIDYFHQLGWMPKTPERVLQYFPGFNQHFGPGGKSMFGARRAYVHMKFCEITGRKVPIPVFCQRVHPQYDLGEMVFVRYAAYWNLGETPQEVADAILPMEHEVQIQGLYKVSVGNAVRRPVHKLAKNSDEIALLEQLRKEAVAKYPRH